MIYISTMNLSVFSQFGWRLVDTFEKYYRGNGKLIVFSESHFFQNHVGRLQFSKVSTEGFDEGLFAFHEKIKNKKWAQGQKFGLKVSGLRNLLHMRGLPKFKLGSQYDYMNDSRRFSFKSFCWVDSLRSFADDLCYLDADCHFFNDFDDSDFLADVGGDIGYFGRNSYTETGILLFKNKEKVLLNFANSLEETYLEQRIFDLSAYTDCHVFDDVRRRFEGKLRFHNFSPIHNNHPIALSPFSRFIDHRKGPRKVMAQSPELKK